MRLGSSSRTPFARRRAPALIGGRLRRCACLAAAGIAACALVPGPYAQAQTAPLGVALSFNDYYSYGHGSVVPFNPQTGRLLPAVSVEAPTAVVLTPDHRTAWVASAAANNSGASGSVVPVNLVNTPPRAGRPVTLPGAVNATCGPNSHRELDALAITPNGHTLYAADAQSDRVYPVDLTSDPARALTPIALSSGSHPAALAISPDGRTLYVADAGEDAVSVISVATNAVRARIALPTGSAPDALAITPDGRRLYVAGAGRHAVLAVSAASRTVGPAVLTGGTPNGLVMKSDGSRVYATIGSANRCLSPAIPASGALGLIPIDTATNQRGARLGDGNYSYPALSTDGGVAYVSTDRQDVQPIDLQTGATEAAIGPIYDVHGITIGQSAPPAGSGSTVQGTVRSGGAGGPGVRDARVELCPTSGSDGCLSEATPQDGSFLFDGLPAGSYTLAAWPSPGSRLIERTDTLTVPANTAVEHDLLLRPANPLPPGVSVSSASGTAHDGVPLVFASSPFTVRVPLQPAQHGQPNSRRVYGAVFQLSSGIGISGVDVAMFEVRYGPDGRPAAVSELLEGPGRISGSGSAAAAHFSRAYSPRSAARPATGQGVEPLCHSRDVFSMRPDDPGGVVLQIRGFPGHDPLTFHFDPVALPSPGPTGNTAVDIAAGGLVAAFNAGIDEVPGFGEYNALIYGLNIAANAAHGNYAQAASNTFFNFAVPQLSSGVRQPLRHGPVQFAAWEFSAGVAQNNIDTQLAPASNQSCTLSELGADLYIDPSGRVVTTHGQPVSGARVVLSHSSTRAGRQRRVPNGSPIMSPANRRNPDRTGRSGLFGWDVLPGFYQVAATHAGCTGRGGRGAAVSPVLQVPPAVTGLILRLRCPKLKYVPARIRFEVRTVRLRGGRYATSFAARVQGRRGAGVPSGTITFLIGKRRLGELALDPRGEARLLWPGRLHGRPVVRYSGDGRYAAGSRRAA